MLLGEYVCFWIVRTFLFVSDHTSTMEGNSDPTYRSCYREQTLSGSQVSDVIEFLNGGGAVEDVVVETDLTMSVVRDDSSSPSWIKFLDLVTREVRTIRFDDATYVNRMVVSWQAAASDADAPSLNCDSGGVTDHQCKGGSFLPFGDHPAVLVEVYFSPQTGATTYLNEWWRNAFTFEATYYKVCMVPENEPELEPEPVSGQCKAAAAPVGWNWVDESGADVVGPIKLVPDETVRGLLARLITREGWC